MKVILAFKKKTSKGFINKLESSAVKFWTKSEYFHVEIIIKDKWISFNTDGIALRDLLPLSDKYDYYEIEVDGRKLKTVMKFIQNQKDKKYDWFGLFFAQFLSTNFDDRDKWFCSEFVSKILKLFSIELSRYCVNYSPGSLKNELHEKQLIKCLEYNESLIQ